MKSLALCRLLSIAILLCGMTLGSLAVTPPVVRSTEYNGYTTNIVYYPVQPWMNTNTVLMTVEAYVYCKNVSGFQAFVSRNFTTNLWFGLNGNRLRFYRSGGTTVDSDGTLVAGRWTHVAVTYDGVNARFYINGTSAGTKALASAGNNCTNSLSLGGQQDGPFGGWAFNGYLDEVRLWSVVRSQSAIQAGMNSELRSGTGLLATFGSGGNVNDIRFVSGLTDGTSVANRWSGFGILPAGLCVPWTRNALRVDGNIDLLNEYRGAETLVLRSTTSSTAPDERAYLMVNTNSTNYHLYVGVPDLPQGGLPQIPGVQVQADVNVNSGATPALGDWRFELDQDTFQGGSIFSTFPPFITVPTWIGWGQSVDAWQGRTAVSFEFHQSYEFRIHARHLNYFTNDIGLMVRYSDLATGAFQYAGPRGAVTNFPATYVRAGWCGAADTDLSSVNLSGTVTNLSGNVGVAGRTVSLYSGDSELGGTFLASTTTDSQGRFFFNSVLAPMERRLAVTYSPPTGVVFLDPAIDATTSPRLPVSINSPSSVTYLPCPSSCTYAKVNFRYRSLGPLQVTGVSPASVPATVVVRASPLKTTGGSGITVTGTNFYSGVRVYFRGSACALIPPSLCTSDFHEANVVSQNIEGTSLEAEVPTALTGVSIGSRSFQIVLYNPAAGGSWTYGPSITVTPPTYPQLYGFEFKNMDDSPSWEEFEACYGDSIFATVPFTDIPIPGARDPYYGVYFLVYMAWMEIAHGSCSGFAATSRLMADGDIPSATFDRSESGDGVHGVLFPNGYVGRPPCRTGDTRLCAPKPGRWTGFDFFQPFRPINVWARIISLQGAQTSAEFLNNWIGQLHRPIPIGPRSGISVGDPVLVLNRIRAEARGNLLTLGGRAFESLHTITPYGVIEEQGLAPDLLSTEPRAGFSLIKAYDSNWPSRERFVEINRAQNTFRYLMGFRDDGTTNIVEGAGLYYTPMTVFRGRRHALGPQDIAANLDHFVRALHTGTATAGVQDGAGGTAGWSGSTLVNTYDGAVPFVPPGFVFGEPDRFDRTMFFLPETNAPTRAWFYSGGSNVFVHYALGEGDIAFGFNAANTGASNSVDGILIGLSQGLQGLGLRAGAPVTGFGAMVSSRDDARQSRVFVIDASAGSLTPDVQLERDGFKSLTIRNRSTSPLPFRLNLAGTDNNVGTFEYAYESFTQPGQSTLKLILPENPAIKTLIRELDTNNDGTPELVEEAPANGQLRISDEAGQIALRWRQAGFGETLEATTTLKPNEWSPVGTPVTREGSDRVARVSPTKSAEFFRLRMPGTNCLSLSAFAPGAKPNPWETNGFKFEALTAGGTMMAQNTIASRGAYTGLDVQHTVRVHPSHDCDMIQIDVFQTSGFVTIEAVGALGVVLGRETMTGIDTAPQPVRFRAFRGRIHYVRVTSPNAQCMIVNVCCERIPKQDDQPNLNCLNFSNATAGQFSSPYLYDVVNISAAPGPVIIGPVSGLDGNWLKLTGQVEIKAVQVNEPCDGLGLVVRDLEGVITVTAYDANNAVVGTAGPPPASSLPQRLAVGGAGIVRFVISSNSDKAVMQEICCQGSPGQ